MRTWVLGLVAIALAAALAGSAGAGGPQPVDVRVTINDDCENSLGPFPCRTAGRARRNYEVQFFGRVRSEVARCERGRTVKVQRTYTGIPGRGVELIGTATSRRSGMWKLTANKPGEGIYRAIVRRETKGNVVCRTAQDTEEHELPFG